MSGTAGRLSRETRAAAERRVRHTEDNLAVIAADLGMSETTLRRWARDEGWRAPRAGPGRPQPAKRPRASVRRASATATADASDVPDLAALRQRLRSHVGRQIAAFDAALRGEGAAVIDSARVLRDLGGLKRLLDDLGTGTGGGDGGHDAALAEPLDLPRLRAEIAERYERLPGGRAGSGTPGGPAGAAPAGTVA